MYAVWLCVILFSVAAEAATAQLISIWFMAGAAAALITSLFTESIAIQIIVFTFVSVVMLALARPILRKVMDFKKEDTNLGRYIGKNAVVTSEIDNKSGKGQVNISGIHWSAKSIGSEVIKKGENVHIESIEGVKLVVSSNNNK